MFILIGGGGFLGRHLRDALRIRGHRSIIVARSPSHTSSKLKDGETVISLDEFNASAPEFIARATAVVYLAAASVPSTFEREPWMEIGQNVEPAISFALKYATASPHVKRILISSGGAIYGNAAVESANEETPTAPISAYGLGKLMIEQAYHFSGRSYGMHYNILRVSNAIGRHHRRSEQGVVGALLRALKNDSEFKLIGDGSIVRDYVDADDVAEAILCACEDRHFNHSVWNVGSGTGQSLRDLVSIVETISHRKLRIVRAPSRKIDVERIVLDCKRIARDIGWRPRHDIADTIGQLWNAS